jgi:hypothetical protein
MKVLNFIDIIASLTFIVKNKKPMPIVRIDEIEYELDHLTNEAKAQLVSVQHTDQKISELQRDLAIAQTARASYANALRELLGHGADATLHAPVGLQVRH